eukprot:TRINITY_DN32557_c0_g1_i9.p2 TRINITY_DN32557_c0_g1~~TRINITY_DN32557_c0_g1_i9.p2  ORF type:complete len:213 (+),score=-20.07 TRINITY_DN32557_c0_g1_i9:447-1085(+)
MYLVYFIILQYKVISYFYSSFLVGVCRYYSIAIFRVELFVVMILSAHPQFLVSYFYTYQEHSCSITLIMIVVFNILFEQLKISRKKYEENLYIDFSFLSNYYITSTNFALSYLLLLVEKSKKEKKKPDYCFKFLYDIIICLNFKTSLMEIKKKQKMFLQWISVLTIYKIRFYSIVYYYSFPNDGPQNLCSIFQKLYLMVQFIEIREYKQCMV